VFLLHSSDYFLDYFDTNLARQQLFMTSFYRVACGRSPAEIVGSNPTGACIFVCCECRVLSGRGLCDKLITRLEESYRLWCVVVCDLET